MVPFFLSGIASVLNAKLVNIDQIIKTVSIDSRIIGEQCLFIALKGSRFDAHDFAAQAVNAGAKALLVSRYLFLNVSQLIVFDTRYALCQLGAWVRRQSTSRIVAITGSMGKTSVKEMTSSILHNCGKVVATYGNFNNDIGVALTLLRIQKQDDFAVVELGSNSFGEIAKTSELVSPHTALINNISYAHLSGFRTLSGVSRAKGEIFIGLSMIGRGIINVNSHDWLSWRHLLCGRSVWRFSLKFTSNVDFFASDIVFNIDRMHFVFHTPQGKSNISLPLLGYHNVSNALAAGALSMSVGASLSDITKGLENMNGLPGRLYPIILDKGKVLLDDTYNSNIGSMLAAVRVLQNMPGYRVIVISDMLELGVDREVIYHYKFGKNIISISNINMVLSIGVLAYFIGKGSGRGKHFFDKSSIVSYLMCVLVKYKLVTILIKGSRVFSMDSIVQELRRRWLC
ncbi:UDP-N-acetylmuramoyl-tripeptide--D-alanyl-D-alanine ligase [Blochmannia endosymbiont of Colobopsis nipponica]|uniref:UDP-N-acetylmuramoyl-tripeptide--D-alanyl-D- alanine ligase n=1 Tax=Blochmannia endosymbiont of Colobopsis nipponica TaxID=2681987 RepID=UPI00177F6CCF|nr:UDP-N-acetylmuramoyl-tripeptide--D-alanyl-D-alanine ligase [Blochmannia endosymbiont of Colobopsis nipponica]QOI11270.1 UDP-N-acetylmuramoyl-tripeptide--D-alanyl-D-alanine ligase [Blochmannia endosymbiont of Colobopsis nipponica]